MIQIDELLLSFAQAAIRCFSDCLVQPSLRGHQVSICMRFCEAVLYPIMPGRRAPVPARDVCKARLGLCDVVVGVLQDRHEQEEPQDDSRSNVDVGPSSPKVIEDQVDPNEKVDDPHGKHNLPEIPAQILALSECRRSWITGRFVTGTIAAK